MNREIKFRGMCVTSNQWLYGSLVTNITTDTCMICNDFTMLTVVRPETVDQFTGLKDKNGTEVYEGDRILYSNSLERGEGVISFSLGFTIEWDLSTVVTGKPSVMSPLFYFGCSQEIEVINSPPAGRK